MNTPPPANRSWLSMLGVCAGVIAAIAAFFFFFRDSSSTPQLDRQAFDQHMDQWRDQKPDDYDITVAVTGMQPAVYEVTVRSGLATSATLDGRPLRDQRTFGTWSVTGMFETLRRDLRTQDEHGYLLLRCEFDPIYGYPKAYERIELRTYAHDALQWTVTRFDVRADDQE
jgi:hypothetical protein